jgi:hypothetical protein
MPRKKKKTRKPRSPAADFFARAQNDPNVAVIDFDKITRESPHVITGSAKDLIRDGYDTPQPWMHNAVANPDDRRRAFLIGRGWSATPEKRRAVRDSGIAVMAVNDYPADGPKPDYWCSGDPASYFGNRIWNDIDVVKFACLETISVPRPREDAYHDKLTSRDAPNVQYFHEVNNETEIESWLHLPYIPWGTSIWGPKVPSQFYTEGAARSSMLIGMRLLWHLGFREVFLLGCDCTPHHHPYPRYWDTMFHLIGQLRPVFDRWGFVVHQTNPASHLRCFRFTSFEEAIA